MTGAGSRSTPRSRWRWSRRWRLGRANRDRDRRAGEIPARRDGIPRPGSSIIATSWTASSGLRGNPGVTVLVYDQTCAAEKAGGKRGTYPDPARRADQRARLRGMRRLRGQVQLPRKPSSDASERSIRAVATRTIRAERLLSEFRDDRGRKSLLLAGGTDRLPEWVLPTRTLRGAFSSRALAVRASSPSARCWAWQRTSRAKAWRCST